jgi:hypothetical protein
MFNVTTICHCVSVLGMYSMPVLCVSSSASSSGTHVFVLIRADKTIVFENCKAISHTRHPSILSSCQWALQWYEGTLKNNNAFVYTPVKCDFPFTHVSGPPCVLMPYNSNSFVAALYEHAGYFFFVSLFTPMFETPPGPSLHASLLTKLYNCARQPLARHRVLFCLVTPSTNDVSVFDFCTPNASTWSETWAERFVVLQKMSFRASFLECPDPPTMQYHKNVLGSQPYTVRGQWIEQIADGRPQIKEN